MLAYVLALALNLPAFADAVHDADRLFTVMKPSLRGCDAYELSARGPFGTGAFDVVDAHHVRAVRRLAARRGPLIYAHDERFTVLIDELLRQMRAIGIVEFSRPRFLHLAGQLHREWIAAGRMGECYAIETNYSVPMQLYAPFYRGFLFRSEAVAIAPERQRLILRAFDRDLILTDPLNESEREHLARGSLSLDEIAELRSIRKATQILQRSTYLLFTFPGDIWVTNNISAWFGNRKQVCHNAARTCRGFLADLDAFGLLKHFREAGPVHRILHEAVGLRRVASDEPEFVLDGWHPWGGEPANLITLEDWRRRRDQAQAVRLARTDFNRDVGAAPPRLLRYGLGFLPAAVALHLTSHARGFASTACERWLGLAPKR